MGVAPNHPNFSRNFSQRKHSFWELPFSGTSRYSVRYQGVSTIDMVDMFFINSHAELGEMMQVWNSHDEHRSLHNKKNTSLQETPNSVEE